MSEREIFTGALKLADPAEQAAYLDRACDGNSELRKRVDTLLELHRSAGDFLERPAAEQLDAALEPSDATQAFGGLAGPKRPAIPRTVHENSGDEESEDLSFLQPATRSDSLGRIGHYEVLQILGKGGFGIVFRAFDDVLHRIVAVKVMSPQLASTSPARKRFLREARSSAQVRHENVVQVHEVGEQPLPHLVMEFIPGETLQQRLDRVGPVEPKEVARIGRQIAEGLAAAHATDLIHRDIKPGNVLLEGGAQRVKITDFGLARAADDASLSQSGLIAGTPMYMAPEQAKGETLDQRADLFSLGSVLYQMAAGRPPFRANGTLAVLKRVPEDNPRAIREIIPETPQWLCDIISKLHAKNPEDRYQSAREVADVLGDCEEQLKANAKLRDFSRIPQSKSPARPVSRRKWVAAAALLIPVLAVVLTVVYWPRIIESITPNGIMEKKPVVVPVVGGTAPLAIAPFDAAKAKEHQDAWSKHLGVEPEIVNSIGMKLRLIPPGEFNMGTDPAEAEALLSNLTEDWQKSFIKSEVPKRRVAIEQPYYLGEHEVTIGQFRAFVKATGHKTVAEATGNGVAFSAGTGKWERHPDHVWTNPRFASSDLHPVTFVAPADAEAFVTWLSGKESLRYAIPTEAQWEHACRAGTESPWFWGAKEADADKYAVFGRTVLPCGSRLANPFGLFDMAGNVNELAFDAKGQPVFRGGGTGNTPEFIRSASRNPDATLEGAQGLGFRVAVVGELKAKTLPLIAVDDAWVNRVAALPAEEQVEAVNGKLKELNPAFDGDVKHKIEDGVVAELRIVTDKVANIAPIRVFNGLRVLDLSGTATPESQWKGQLADLTPLKEMNLAGLREIHLRGTKISDEGLTAFRDCKSLTGLALRGTRVGDKGLAHLQSCTQLNFLELVGTAVTDQGLIHLKDCKNLTFLDLSHTNVSDVGMAYIKDFNLTSLILNGTQITNAGLALLKDCTSLANLSVGDTQVTNEGLAFLKDRSNVTNLGVWSTRVDDAGLAYFKNCKNLKQLWLQNTQVSDVGLDNFKDCKDLNLLDVRKTKVTAVKFEELKKALPNCKIEWDGVDDAWVKRVAALPAEQQIDAVKGKLKDLNPGFDGDVKHKIEGGVVIDLQIVTDKVTNISPIQVFNGLRVLDLSGSAPARRQLADLTPLKGMNLVGLLELHLIWTKVEDAGLAHFKDCKSLTSLRLAGTQVSDDGVAYFKDCKNLSILGLDSTKVSDRGMACFKDCKNFTVISLDNTKVGDAGLAHFKDYKNLTWLHINETKVSDGGLAYFKDCNLTILALSGTKVSDAGLAQFTNIKNLEHLDLRMMGPNVSDVGLAHFKDCEKLTHLFLGGPQVSDACLDQFRGCKDLTLLNLQKTKVTAAKIEELKKALPNCKIEWDGAPAKVDAQPFVVLDAKSKEELRFATLAQAVAEAADGDILEIRGNGPFELTPMTLSRALTIRAGSGARPVLVHTTDGSMFKTTASLALEGLEIKSVDRKPIHEKGQLGLIHSTRSKVRIANCRILITGGLQGVYGDNSPLIEVRNSQIFTLYSPVSWIPPDNGRLVIENCAVSSWCLFGIDWTGAQKASNHSVDLSGNTVVASGALDLNRMLSDPAMGGETAPSRARYRLTGNVIQSRDSFHHVANLRGKTTSSAMAAWQREHVAWDQQQNLYSVGDRYLYLETELSGKPETDCRTLKEWQTFCNLKESPGIEAEPQFRGGNLRDRSENDPLAVVPADYRLVKRSAGQGVGPGGKDLGADVDSIGPGPAYER